VQRWRVTCGRHLDRPGPWVEHRDHEAHAVPPWRVVAQVPVEAQHDLVATTERAGELLHLRVRDRSRERGLRPVAHDVTEPEQDATIGQSDHVVDVAGIHVADTPITGCSRHGPRSGSSERWTSASA
jgi:hypothetical protein